MKALNTNLYALAAAAVFTVASLFAINSRVTVAPLGEINGTKVVDLAPVLVTPSTQELRDAAVTAEADVAIALPGLARRAENGAAALGAQLAMPYYSFGSKFGRISKE